MDMTVDKLTAIVIADVPPEERREKMGEEHV
jgi:hypothetical protein